VFVACRRRGSQAAVGFVGQLPRGILDPSQLCLRGAAWRIRASTWCAPTIICSGWRSSWLAIANNVAQKSLLVASPEPSIPSTPTRGAVSPSNRGPAGRSIIERSRIKTRVR
jgi:hypothetical protein